MLPWNCEGPVCWKSGSCGRWAYNSTPETFWESHLTTILNLCQGPGGLFSFTKNSTCFSAPRMSKNTLTILPGREADCVCQAPHRQTHGIKSNWPLLLLITNWTKLSNLTPGLEAVPAPLWALHNLPQNQSKRVSLPHLSTNAHDTAPNTAMGLCKQEDPLLLYCEHSPSIKIKEKLCLLGLS